MLAGINTLPPELLISIFLKILESDTTNWSLHLGRLYLTCSRWYNILNLSPAAWSHISNKFHRTYNDAALVKSSSHILNVTCELENHHLPLEQDLESIYVDTHRWRTIRFNLPIRQETRTITQVLEKEFPSLESAHIILTSYPPPFLPSLFASADRLRDVNISGLGFDWEFVSWRDLTSLKIRLPGGQGPSSAQVLEVLRRCPNLESLALTFIKCTMPPCDSTGDPVQLQSFRDLCISCVPNPKFAIDVINGIVGLPCSSLAIDIDDRTPLPYSVLHTITTFLPSPSPSTFSDKRLIITVEPRSIRVLTRRIGTDDFDDTLRLGLSRVPLPWTLETLHSAMSSSLIGAVKILHIRSPYIPDPHWQDEEIFTALTAFSGVETIWVRGRMTELVIRHLGEPNSDEEHGQVYFPQLHTLNIEEYGRSGFTALHLMLQTRFRQRGAPPPARFRCITVSREWQMTSERDRNPFVDIVGLGVIRAA